MNADDNTEPTLEELLTGVAELVARRSLGGWLPGRVESYDAATGRANVQPLLLEPRETEAGGRETRRLPVINDVPVGMLGAGGMRVRFPVSKGDTVVLLFCARSSDKWKKLGGELDPDDDERHHSLSDAIAIPLDLSVPTRRNAGAFIEFTSTNTVEIGGSDRLVTKTEFDTHTHPAPGGATSAPTTPATGTSKLRG